MAGEEHDLRNGLWREEDACFGPEFVCDSQRFHRTRQSHKYLIRLVQTVEIAVAHHTNELRGDPEFSQSRRVVTPDVSSATLPSDSRDDELGRTVVKPGCARLS